MKNVVPCIGDHIKQEGLWECPGWDVSNPARERVSQGRGEGGAPGPGGTCSELWSKEPGGRGQDAWKWKSLWGAAAEAGLASFHFDNFIVYRCCGWD